mmetsp:Transcript_4498/g.15944  ORF Transcript_4498/g.15944 Transcript_4498/m.15944 type:complete len:437 (-) Transcript_4498:1063-2373(-)
MFGAGSDGAPVGMCSFHTGIKFPETLFNAPETLFSTPPPRTPCAADTRFRNVGTTLWNVAKFLASALAPDVAVDCFFRSRSRIDLTSSPVLMPTGHFTWHMPSAAHVASPSYVNLSKNSSRRACCALSRVGMSCRREISRYTVMRCLGVRLRSREGQLLSQKPHSMHMSTIGSATGLGFKNFWCMSLSLERITPGFNTYSGSNSSLSSHMSSYALFPHSISTNGATFLPVPCSALSDPLYLVATISHISSIIAAYRFTSSSFRKPCENTRCKLPSSAWPMHDASSYPNRSNMSIRSWVMSPSLSTSHATSSMSTDVPALREDPTRGISPFLTSQYTLYTASSFMNGYVDTRSLRYAKFAPSRDVDTSLIATSSSSSVAPRHSMSNAAPRFGASAMVGTSPMICSCPSHCVSDARSKSSTASTVVSLRSTAAARHAS